MPHSKHDVPYPQQYQYATEGAGRREGSQTAEGRGKEQIFARRIRLPSHIRVPLPPNETEGPCSPSHPCSTTPAVHSLSFLDIGFIAWQGGREGVSVELN